MPSLYFLIHYFYAFFIALLAPPRTYRTNQTTRNEKEYIPSSTIKKPSWVINEIIHIKAMNPHLSHRLIASIFNSRFDAHSVGKTFVGYTLKDHLYEVQILRKKLKNRPAHKIAFNTTWGLDLTFINQEPILGVVEHHSRKLLTLVPLQQKSSAHILLTLLPLLTIFPKPKQIRTDNESCFTSKLMRFALWFLGIKHQKIEKSCPWQNGRIERLFSTLKNTLKLTRYDKEDLPYLTYSFTWWYNNIRAHMNLNYQTPQSVYEEQIDSLYRKRQNE